MRSQFERDTNGTMCRGRNPRSVGLATGEPSAQLHATASKSTLSALLGTRAATLNQNCQYHDNQNTGHNPDNQGVIHIDSSFPQ
jgi:hypothetical protein